MAPAIEVYEPPCFGAGMGECHRAFKTVIVVLVVTGGNLGFFGARQLG